MKKFFIGLMSALLVFSFTGQSFANAESNLANEKAIQSISDEGNFFHKDTNLFLQAIVDVPDEIVKQGIESTITWIENDTGLDLHNDNGVLKMTVDGEGTKTVGQFQTFGFWSCTSAVLAAVAGVGIPFTKIFKLKKAIDALGGVSKFVDDVVDLASKYKDRGYSKTGALKKLLKN